uniref:DDE-type integrase/transposase/recombinase n=1 Tax=Sphingomonas sp. CFBP 13720 TaxID=2775302 RepID=UPI00313904F5
MTKTRDKDAAPAFMKKAFKRHGSPEAITTNGLRSYRAATIVPNDQAQTQSGIDYALRDRRYQK